MNDVAHETVHEDGHHVVGTSAHQTDGGRVLKNGDAFLIVDRQGDIQATGRGEQGLYYRGTRHVSKLRVRFGKRHPMLLCSSVLENNMLLAVDLSNPEMPAEPGHVPHGTVHVARRAILEGGAYLERIHLCNYGSSHVRLPLRLELDADFCDIFEVRGTARRARGAMLEPEIGESFVRLRYVGLDERVRTTTFAFSRSPDAVTRHDVTFDLALDPKQETTIDLTIECQVGSSESPVTLRAEPTSHEQAATRALALVRQDEMEQTGIHTSNRQFNRWLDRARADLRMLVTRTQYGPYPYAGVPWFSTVFGRDGIITALQMLWLDSSLAAGVLRFLSAHQATDADAEQDAEPGKILHELRDGEMAALREIPFGRYYGTVDATPLYLMLAAAYYKTTGDLGLVMELWPNLLRAMDWVDRYGDWDGDGFIEYGKRSSQGLVQQGWKDSNDSVFHADGTLAEAPIALCEVQGYAYAARRGMADVARAMGEVTLGALWDTRAEKLQAEFDRAFWCEELSTYALALDAGKRPCRVKTSNAGHCLYTGIALPSRLPALAKQLMSDVMFSGWGIRTLAADEARYNPMSYHNGSVWPHDNAIAAEGLARSGYRWEAAALLETFFDAASFMDFQRLPELFCGFARHAGQEPIRYPVACLPQAWASSAPFALLAALLGIETDAAGQRLTLRHPILPGFIDTLEIRRLAVGNQRVDLRLVRHPEDVGVTASNMTAPIDVVVIK